MTGADFRGLHNKHKKKDVIDEFINYSTEKYEKIIGYKPSSM